MDYIHRHIEKKIKRSPVHVQSGIGHRGAAGGEVYFAQAYIRRFTVSDV